ncbi:MAG: phage terminase large subunit [Tissierellia bacterium]|nr:phage terminase large subunit [Tissierellia bacterium]
MQVNRKELIYQAKLALARKELFYYCKTKAPDFYKDDREYLISLCNELQEFNNSDYDILVINEPPRHGKSRTAQLYVEWSLGNNPKLKIMTGSYNETVATQFSKGVRNSIMETKADRDKIVYSDVFPGIRIKEGDGATNLWSLEDGYTNYLATSPTGTATGFGADRLLIDDLIKNSLEANDINVLDKHWEWFTNTMLSRLESGGKIIIIMTRWHSKDLAGRVLEEMPKLGYKVKHMSEKALKEDGTMLCEDVLSREEYDRKTKTMGADIASANYQQEPIDIKGKLYSSFKTYTDIPRDKQGNSLFTAIKMYSDTADQGSDFLCNIIYGEYNKEAYVLDVYYTKEPMEITEGETAKRIVAYNVNYADIESNNGGRGYARAVKGKLKRMGHNRCRVTWFHQSKNKVARILSNATWVMDHIYFPNNWRDRWPEYYKAMYEYQREGKNAHDDAPDATTGVAEKCGRAPLLSFD